MARRKSYRKSTRRDKNGKFVNKAGQNKSRGYNKANLKKGQKRAKANAKRRSSKASRLAQANLNASNKRVSSRREKAASRGDTQKVKVGDIYVTSTNAKGKVSVRGRTVFDTKYNAKKRKQTVVAWGAAGTAVMPGVGTAAGVMVGRKLAKKKYGYSYKDHPANLRGTTTAKDRRDHARHVAKKHGLTYPSSVR